MNNSSNFLSNDLFVWMRRALQLASLGNGSTSPNPCVGAVVLNEDGQLVGDGFHAYAGGCHAEVKALAQAGDRAKGGTLFVTLEPCCHYGRTPPCTEAILKSEIRRVVVGLKDPDPRVSGGGISFLQDAGIDVVSGILAEQVAYQNRDFIFRVKNGRPWGILKCAVSLDGRIGLSNGESKWISGTESRKEVHRLRANCDAVIVGGGTVRADNPLLTSRGLSIPEPLRVVLTNTLNLPADAKIFDTSIAKTLVAYRGSLEAKKLNSFKGDVEFLPLTPSEPIELAKKLAEKGCNRVLWECGAKLATTALKQECIQELLVVLAPKLLGGDFAMTPLEDLGFTSMEQVLSMNFLSFQKQGNDLHLRLNCSENYS